MQILENMERLSDFCYPKQEKKIEKLRNQTFSWRTQKPRTKRNQNQDEKPKLKSIFFLVISVSYKKEKRKEKNLSYQRIQKRKRNQISYLNVIKKKKIIPKSKKGERMYQRQF